ncbi:NAD-dependent epimerase/dehydratase family protein [Gammaproteobacteria bacterium]|nr:NAD-dependent epimerase/dehydratase family protein [Gammaproteobacteria bacterium]
MKTDNTKWPDRKVLVTGGCSFIGSHLVDALVSRGASVRVVDNLSSGRKENIQHLIDSGEVEFHEADLLEGDIAEQSVDGVDNVFHLAADHGGRGYIELHQAACSTNLALDGLMIRAAHHAGIDHFTFSSSGCVYPTDLQSDPSQTVYLTEDIVRPPYQADDLYGWAKLMAELSLKAYHRDYGLKCASLRYFTVYGERCTESHAVIAMIARAFVRQDPFVVWGTGEQIRNWTYVGDIVDGTIRAAERIEDGAAINLGTMERISVIDAANAIIRDSGYEPVIETDPSKPTGPYNRVADNSLAGILLDWSPRVGFYDGLEQTMRWYHENHEITRVSRNLEERLTER